MKNFKTTTKYSLILTLAMLMSSCSSMLYTSIDILKPARVYFPEEVHHILIVNNATPQPSDLGHRDELFDEKEKKVSINTDSLPIFAINSFANEVINKEFFGNVDFKENTLSTGNNFLLAKPVNKTLIDSLMNNADAQAAISLNRVVVYDLKAELYNETANNFVAYLEARYELQWSVYYKGANNSISLITRDTLYWESPAFSKKKALEGLPNRYDALIDGAILAGQKAVNHFIPYWIKADRYFFTSSDTEFKKGIDAVYTRDWKEARQIWTAMYSKAGNSYIKGKLANNLAVVNEILGDIDKASEYAESSWLIFYNMPIMDYKSYWLVAQLKDELEARKKEYSKIKLQLGN